MNNVVKLAKEPQLQSTPERCFAISGQFVEDIDKYGAGAKLYDQYRAKSPLRAGEIVYASRNGSRVAKAFRVVSSSRRAMTRRLNCRLYQFKLVPI